MDERRQSIRQESFLRGRVYFNNGRNSVNCLVRDISYEGTRITGGSFNISRKNPL